MNKKTTIRDVAKATGLSITTISQILNGIGRFSDATIERVWKAVNEMNYTPNEYARKIFAKETAERQKNDLLMRIVYFPYDHNQLFPIEDNNMEAHSMVCFELACQSNGYNGTNYYYRHRHGFRNKLLLNGRVDGAVLCTYDSTIVEYVRQRIPVVLTDAEVEPEDIGLSVINPDYCAAYKEAFTLIQNAGFSGKVACFNGMPKKEISMYSIFQPDAETAVLKKAMEQSGIEVNGKYFYDDYVSPDTNEPVIEEIADKICYLVREENVRTVALLHHDFKNLAKKLSDRGLKFPEDVILLGKSSLMSKQDRGMIQIVQDWKKLQDKAVDVLVKTIDTPDMPCKKYLVPCFGITDTL
ncbi:MAG: LacI family DNA-binding transcriptional regulator [Lentisphaeria bacterium]|nr:LacI family DNA-binding transcriptional regulator [Lentisphaeria bacterium]